MLLLLSQSSLSLWLQLSVPESWAWLMEMPWVFVLERQTVRRWDGPWGFQSWAWLTEMPWVFVLERQTVRRWDGPWGLQLWALLWEHQAREACSES
jgi:hypothetical protein